LPARVAGRGPVVQPHRSRTGVREVERMRGARRGCRGSGGRRFRGGRGCSTGHGRLWRSACRSARRAIGRRSRSRRRGRWSACPRDEKQQRDHAAAHGVTLPDRRTRAAPRGVSSRGFSTPC
jgi:hypothetical protein